MKLLLTSFVSRPHGLSIRLAASSPRLGKTERTTVPTGTARASAGKRFLDALLRSFSTPAI